MTIDRPLKRKRHAEGGYEVAALGAPCDRAARQAILIELSPPAVDWWAAAACESQPDRRKVVGVCRAIEVSPCFL